MEEVYSFGYWVLRRRKALDLTRARLAQRVSCSPETIKKIERDERRPSRQVAELLAEALAVPGGEREPFLRAARGEFPVDRLPTVSGPLAPLAPPRNLPPQATAFVGREAELAALDAHLADPAIRLITILGPGGMGKTRLALAAAEASWRAPDYSFPHGVYFVSLAPLSAPDQLLPAIAEALNFRFYPGGEPRQQLIDYLRHKRLLLLLDNFEHLKAGAGLVSDLLAAAPGLKALVTSRERLNLWAEQLFPISGLSLPDDEVGGVNARGDGAASGAVRLFEQNARSVRPGFALTPRNQPYVIEICRLVGGAPLGIVLAAGWLSALSAEEVAAEIGRDLDFLAVEMADVPERQRSLRAAFNHSWRLLTESERAVFRRLSVFRGGFDRAAAEAVVAAAPRDLQALVNKSLLVRTGRRYDVHELLRQFAAEKLAESPDEEAATRERHSAHYGAFLRDLTEDWHSVHQLEALAAVTREADNVRPALQWALAQEAWQRLREAIEGWARYLEWQGRGAEGVSFCRAIAAKAGALDKGGTALSPKCLRLWSVARAWMSLFALQMDDFQLASGSIAQSLALLERPELAGQDVRRERAFAHLVWNYGPEESEWRRHAEQSLALYQDLGEQWAIAECLQELAYVDWWVDGRLMAGYEKLQWAYEIQRNIGDLRAQVRSLHDLALVHKDLGHLDETERLQREVIRLSLELGARPFLPVRHTNLAFTLCWQGQYEEAIHHAEAGWAIAQDLGQDHDGMVHLAIGYNLMHAGHYGPARDQLAAASIALEARAGRSGAGMANAVSGKLALAESDYVVGQARLLKSIEIFQEAARHLIGWSMGDLAMADYHLNQPSRAREHLVEALTGALVDQNYMSAVSALPGAALLLAASGDTARAVEIWALAQCIPIMANSSYYEDLAGRELAAVAASLPPEVAEAARERGRASDLWATAADLLLCLEGALPT
jgi:predicted ATPase/DNA-binding XRE family transcriptional regulator